jgi:hypothetical protein
VARRWATRSGQDPNKPEATAATRVVAQWPKVVKARSYVMGVDPASGNPSGTPSVGATPGATPGLVNRPGCAGGTAGTAPSTTGSGLAGQSLPSGEFAQSEQPGHEQQSRLECLGAIEWPQPEQSWIEQSFGPEQRQFDEWPRAEPLGFNQWSEPESERRWDDRCSWGGLLIGTTRCGCFPRGGRS